MIVAAAAVEEVVAILTIDLIGPTTGIDLVTAAAGADLVRVSRALDQVVERLQSRLDERFKIAFDAVEPVAQAVRIRAGKAVGYDVDPVLEMLHDVVEPRFQLLLVGIDPVVEALGNPVKRGWHGGFQKRLELHSQGRSVDASYNQCHGAISFESIQLPSLLGTYRTEIVVRLRPE
ncbi:hypothetical protein FHG66_16240 [Rubellimicrobium rubrum]|uniref:Uncharacterized protein n=1 Tax=Rubellimicrobium rubrum TaxID=2585369 RepID=A0A5C4MTE6_9RHOB|nr:hypothetical protein FHG66_16240 [Rubellimicrobium rubrum]